MLVTTRLDVRCGARGTVLLVLFYAVLCCAVLYCSVLCCAVLFSTVLSYSILL
jgi:hypothetical protein